MRACLAATLLCLHPAFASAAEPAPAAADAQPAAPADPSAAAPAKADEKRDSRKPAAADAALGATATAFYRALVARDVEALTALSKPPFYFESKVAASAEEIRRKWSESLQGRPLPELTLYDVELLAYEEMVARHGKPPEKLSAWPTKGATLSIGNVDGHAVLVLWRKTGAIWQACAIHD